MNVACHFCVYRFAGPATSVKVFCSTHPPLATPEARDHGVRTDGQGVVETSHRFTQLVLHPEQLKLLNNPPDKASIVGPPGECFIMLYIRRL